MSVWYIEVWYGGDEVCGHGYRVTAPSAYSAMACVWAYLDAIGVETDTVTYVECAGLERTADIDYEIIDIGGEG